MPRPQRIASADILPMLRLDVSQSGNSSASSGPSATWPPSPGTGAQIPPASMSAADAKPGARPEHDLGARVSHVAAARRSRDPSSLSAVSASASASKSLRRMTSSMPQARDHVARPDDPGGVGQMDGIAGDRAGDVDDGRARAVRRVGEHRHLDRSLDVREIRRSRPDGRPRAARSGSGTSAKRALVPPISPISTGKGNSSEVGDRGHGGSGAFSCHNRNNADGRGFIAR